MSAKAQRIWTLCLMLFLAGLLGVGYFLMNRRPKEIIEDVAESTSIQLIRREEEEVSSITFISENSREILTPFTNDAGRISWEYSAANDYILLPRIVREKAQHAWLISAVGIAHEDSSAVELSAFGLIPPVLTVEVTFNDGESHVLRLGSQTSDYRHYFLMIDDDPAIYLVTAILGDRFLYDVGDMLDLSLPIIDVAEAEYIRIATPGNPPVVLELRGEDSPPSPLEGLVDEIGGEQLIMSEPMAGLSLSYSRLLENVIQPLSMLRFSEVAEINPTDLSPFGLDAPSLEIVYRTGQTELHLFFGDTFTRDEAEYIYVKDANRPHVFIAESEHALFLAEAEPLEIAERFLALVPIDDVESIIISSAAGENIIVMNHIFETFDIEPTLNGVPVQDTDVRYLYMQMLGLLADAQIDVPLEAIEGEPELVLTYNRIGNPDTELRFFYHNANFLAVSINGDDAMFATNRRAINRLTESLEGLQ